MTESTTSPHAVRGQPESAAGTRRATERLEREAAVRRAVFVTTLAGFVGVFGLVAFSAAQAPAANAPTSAPMTTAVASGQVLAEVPITTADGATIVRIIAPREEDTAPRVRTRATP